MSLKPLVVKFSVHDEKEGEGKVLAEAVNERFLLGDGVSRLRVKVGNLEGVMFTPPGSGPFPAVLDLSSFISEKRASLLANKGFVVLAVDVFPHKPDSFKEIHLDSYKEAIDFLLGQPKVGGKGIGITSRSKASDIALSLAAFLPNVKACVWINGASANTLVPLYYEKRRLLSPIQFNSNKLIQTASGACMSKYAYENTLGEGNEGSLIPIEQAKGHFLFVASEDDRFWDSKAHMDQMVQRLKRHGKNNFESVSYPRAGHMLEPPYGPFCLSCPNGFFPYQSLWGGETRAHATAEVHLWKTIQEFLRTSLSFVDTNKSKVNK